MGKVPILPFGIVLEIGQQGPEELGSNPTSNVSLLCTLGQRISSLWASVSPSLNGLSPNTDHLKLLLGINGNCACTLQGLNSC